MFCGSRGPQAHPKKPTAGRILMIARQILAAGRVLIPFGKRLQFPIENGH